MNPSAIVAAFSEAPETSEALLRCNRVARRAAKLDPSGGRTVRAEVTRARRVAKNGRPDLAGNMLDSVERRFWPPEGP